MVRTNYLGQARVKECYLVVTYDEYEFLFNKRTFYQVIKEVKTQYGV